MVAVQRKEDEGGEQRVELIDQAGVVRREWVDDVGEREAHLEADDVAGRLKADEDEQNGEANQRADQQLTRNERQEHRHRLGGRRRAAERERQQDERKQQ